MTQKWHTFILSDLQCRWKIYQLLVVRWGINSANMIHESSLHAWLVTGKWLLMFTVELQTTVLSSTACITIVCHSNTSLAITLTTMWLTHWGRVTYIWVGNLIIIGSDNGLSPNQHQAITWTSAGILLIGILLIHFSEILIKIHIFSFTKMHFKMSSAKRRPFYLGPNVLRALTNNVHLYHRAAYVQIWMKNAKHSLNCEDIK